MKTRLEIVRGDVTTCAADAIVNAANSSLLGTVSEECSRQSGVEWVLFVCHSRHDADVYAAAFASAGVRADVVPGPAR